MWALQQCSRRDGFCVPQQLAPSIRIFNLFLGVPEPKNGRCEPRERLSRRTADLGRRFNRSMRRQAARGQCRDRRVGDVVARDDIRQVLDKGRARCRAGAGERRSQAHRQPRHPRIARCSTGCSRPTTQTISTLRAACTARSIRLKSARRVPVAAAVRASEKERRRVGSRCFLGAATAISADECKNLSNIRWGFATR